MNKVHVITWLFLLNLFHVSLSCKELNILQDFLDSVWVTSSLKSMEKCRFQKFFKVLNVVSEKREVKRSS